MAQPYTRKVFYYETDKMGIVHHSNYVRWLEEARIHYTEQASIPFVEIEARGVQMPVVDVYCKYLTPLIFGQSFKIDTKLIEYNGIRLKYSYEVYCVETGDHCLSGVSTHCFIDEVTRRPVNMKKRIPDFSELAFKLLEEEKKDL